MPATELAHPSVAELTAFGLGKLPPEQRERIESHISACDECCHRLSQVGDDTLVQLARGAPTQVRKKSATKPAKATPPKIPPQLIDHPRYEVLGLLGSGGMGAVYQARHRMMERAVALKVINQALTANARYVERFRREVKAAARLAHPNIVTAYDADQAGDLHFLVMECIDGLSLDRLVAKRGALKPQEAANVIKQAAQGLQHAHERGMLHRDIKPQNLMVTRQGQVKILDFGLARLTTEDETSAANGQQVVEVAEEDDSRTKAGMLLGTPDYMAPEQARDASTADIRSDIYSLGCTLYYLLTGMSPIPPGTVIEKLQSHLTVDPAADLAARGDVPPELVRIVGRMTAKRPLDRHQTPSEVAQDLSAWLKQKPADLPPLTSLADSLLPLPAIDPLAAPLSLPTARPQAISPLRGFWKPYGLWVGGGAAGLVVLVLLSFAMSGPGKGMRNDAIASGAISPQPETKITNSTSAQKPQGEIPVASKNSSSSPAVAAAVSRAPGKTVLFVLPQEYVWYEDYGPTRERLEAGGVRVVVASSSDGPCRLAADSRGVNVQPDVVLDMNLDLSRYDAVIFGGAVTSDFVGNGKAVEATKRLLQTFYKGGKPVTAICRGQGVLAGHGLLKGRPAAANDYIIANFPGSGADWRKQGVVVDGQLITGADQWAAVPFANAVLGALVR